MFGEILGLWAAVTWEQIGRPDPVLLVEAGPGRGTLMADALRADPAAWRRHSAAALRLHLIETSPRLRAVQAERLPDATWHDELETLPDAPLLLLANEFLDALPIRQFVRRGRAVDGTVRGGWAVCRMATTSPQPASRGGSADGPLAASGRGWREVRPSSNSTNPRSPSRRSLGARLAARPGAALFLDYGPERSSPGDSLQALRDGRPADPARGARHRRPHRPCRLRRLRRRRPRGRRGSPWPRSRRACSSPASACSSAPIGSHAPSRPSRASRLDRGRAPPCRTEPHGPAVQGAGLWQPGLPDAPRVRVR